MRFATFITAAIALSLSACSGGDKTDGAPKLAKVAAPAGKAWSDSAVKSTEGGYIIGNPNAKIKLIEYASTTCSHCAEFEEVGYADLLRNYVGTGQVSFEIRNYLLNPYDIPISILTRCDGPENYLGLTTKLFQNQRIVLETAAKADIGKMNAAMKLPDNVRFVELSKEMGLTAFFKSQGLSEEKANKCLSDPAAAKELITMTEAASKLKVDVTPTFFINGKMQADLHSWPALKQKLQELGAG
jgi:protein-disulfide isomerase